MCAACSGPETSAACWWIHYVAGNTYAHLCVASQVVRVVPMALRAPGTNLKARVNVHNNIHHCDCRKWCARGASRFRWHMWVCIFVHDIISHMDIGCYRVDSRPGLLRMHICAACSWSEPWQYGSLTEYMIGNTYAHLCTYLHGTILYLWVYLDRVQLGCRLLWLHMSVRTSRLGVVSVIPIWSCYISLQHAAHMEACSACGYIVPDGPYITNDKK